MKNMSSLRRHFFSLFEFLPRTQTSHGLGPEWNKDFKSPPPSSGTEGRPLHPSALLSPSHCLLVQLHGLGDELVSCEHTLGTEDF
jgi:hypothetical protein